MKKIILNAIIFTSLSLAFGSQSLASETREGCNSFSSGKTVSYKGNKPESEDRVVNVGSTESFISERNATVTVNQHNGEEVVFSDACN
jgi:hypothetical protein